MATFDQHLENIAHAISVDAETRSFLEKDFELIRAYLVDILRNDPVFRPILLDTIASASNFNCSFVFDFSRYMPLGALQTKYPSFIKLAQRGRCKVLGMQDLPFFSNGESIAGGIVTGVVKGLIAQGLNLSGYFVRGHKGDIYELEVIDESKHADYAHNDWDREWQTNYIMLQATSEAITLKMCLRVLLKFCNSERPRDFMPYPTHRLKMMWLAAADVRYLEYFSLCSPLSERELAASPVNLLALRLLITLLDRIKLYTLKKNHLESVSFEIIYTKAQKASTHTTEETITNVILAIIQRMIEYFDKNNFPWYWDIKRNLLQSFGNHANKVHTRNRLRTLLDHIKNMRHNQQMTYEEVESFFGIEINSQIYYVDDFGVYRYFLQT